MTAVVVARSLRSGCFATVFAMCEEEMEEVCVARVGIEDADTASITSIRNRGSSLMMSLSLTEETNSRNGRY